MQHIGESVRNSVWALIRFLRLGGLMLQIHPKSFLRNRGWFRSFSAKRSVDAEGRPIPWWSYGVIDFVDERLAKTMSVLEFGSGGSTVWLAARVSEVVTVENDPEWAAIVKSFIPGNVHLIELPIPGQLVANDIPAPTSRHYQLLIVDALANRIDCAKAGLPFLTEDGVVLWDNTDGPDWPEINGLMAARGFKEISFSGIPPQEVSLSRTTIFYKSNNVFGI
jgi:hypothetical protein